MRTGNTGFSFAKRKVSTHEIHADSLILPVPLLSRKQIGTNRSLSSCFFQSKVGGRRGTITGPFSTSPFRTVLAPFSAHGSPVDDSHSGSGSYTSRALLPFNCHPPVPLPHVSAITLSS